jgi:hypothetical protein
MFFGALALVALTRSTYGPIWIVAIGAALLWLRPFDRKAILKTAAIPLALVLLHSVKTPLLLDASLGDALLWPNLAKKVWLQIPNDEKERLLADGRVSPAMKYEAFSPLPSLAEIRVPQPPTGIPSLDMDQTPLGRTNHHNVEHIHIALTHWKADAKFLVKNYPGAYFDGVKSALFEGYPRSPTNDMVLERSTNFFAVRKADRFLKNLGGRGKHDRLWLLTAALPIAALYALWRLVRARAKLVSQRSTVAALSFIGLTILYVTATTTLVSWGDFSRYRFDVDALYLVLFALMAEDACVALGRAWRWSLGRIRAARASRAPVGAVSA